MTVYAFGLMSVLTLSKASYIIKFVLSLRAVFVLPIDYEKMRFTVLGIDYYHCILLLI